MSSKAASVSANEPAPKKSKKMLFIIVGVVLALAGGGGGYYYMAAKKAAAEAAEDSDAPTGKNLPKRPIFVPLDPFTVNLADPGGEKMAQISINLQISDAKISEEIKAFMPAIRHNVLKIISSRESRELLTSDGKDKLAEEIAIATALPLGWSPSEEDAPVKEKSESPDKSAKDTEKAAKPGAGDKNKAKKMKRRAPPPNPIEQVHFSQFIVQ